MTTAHPPHLIRRLAAFIRQYHWWFVVGLMLITTLLAYGDSLRLPFFFDDLAHLPRLHSQSLLDVFLTSGDQPYYRPVAFFVWKLYEALFGRDSVLIYHILNLLLHCLNAVLVVQVVRRVMGANQWRTAILAGLIFVVFPFAYQAVPLAVTINHLLAACFTLLTVLAYDRFRTLRRPMWLALALLCALLAFGSNEGGFGLVGVVATFEFIVYRRDRQWKWIAFFAGLAALYYSWYQSRPRQNAGPLIIRNVETIVQNTAYILQGLTFPAQLLGPFFMDHGANDQVAAFVLGGAALLTVAALFVYAKRVDQLTFALGWYVSCTVLAIVLLSHNYLINGPRVMYTASVGTACLWAGAIDIVWGMDPHRRWRQAAGIICAGAVLLPAMIFIRQRMDLYMLNAAPLNRAIEIANEARPGSRLVFVNLPAWANRTRAWFPIGHEGVLFLPNYTNLKTFLSSNTGQPSSAIAIEFDNLTTPQPYYYGVYGAAIDWEPLAENVRRADRIYVALYSPESIDLAEAGRLLPSSTATENILARFDARITLHNATWSICNDKLWVNLQWQVDQPTPDGQHVFVHVLNPDGSLVAQHDSPPMMGLYPFWQFRTEDHVEDIHSIDLSALAPDRLYTIAIGLYDPATGQRLTATDLNGHPLPDNAVRLGDFTRAGDDACH